MDLDPAPWAEPRYDRVEWYPSLDVNHLRRVGALALDNGVGGWSVSQTKGVRVLVTYDHAQRCACLNCDGDGTWVVIDWTPCRFGGDRPWFLCPMCATRRVKLHLVAGTWGRAAYVTPWATRLNGSRDRLLLKAVRLRSRVGRRPPCSATWYRRSQGLALAALLRASRAGFRRGAWGALVPPHVFPSPSRYAGDRL